MPTLARLQRGYGIMHWYIEGLYMVYRTSLGLNGGLAVSISQVYLQGAPDSTHALRTLTSFVELGLRESFFGIWVQALGFRVTLHPES